MAYCSAKAAALPLQARARRGTMAAMSLKSMTARTMPRLRRDHLLWLALLLLPLLSVLAALHVQRSVGVTGATLPAPRSAPSRIGNPAPQLALPRLGDGEVVTLAALRGRPVIVNFWASWCEPCAREMPALAAFARSQQGAAQVLAVNLGEDEATARDFLNANDAHGLTVLLDVELRARDAWGVRGLPVTFLVDPAGRIGALHAGEITQADLSAWLASGALP